MKRGILVGSLAGVVLLAVALYNSNTKEYYKPRVSHEKNDGANGAMEWLHTLRADQSTGVIDPADVIAARNAVRNLKAKKGSALNLRWSEMGPVNIGGRTRAIMFDKDNSNIIFAGGVSGGLFKSTTGGSSWTQVNDMASNLAVVSICQAANGDIYYGTGEGMYYDATGSGTGGIVGGGIFKSTDGGNTFQVLPSTIPSPNSQNTEFAAVGKLGADPNDPDRIYAATNRGLVVSDDGGTSWTSALGFNSVSKDMTVTPSGVVWVKQGQHIYKSESGDPGTYQQITVSGGGGTDIPANPSRMRIAVAPQDENYVYVISTRNGSFDKAYQSKDGGETWRVIGEVSSQINPHAQSQPQGEFNNAVAVSPVNKERIFVGGVTLWEWSEQNGWIQIGSLSYSPTNPFYVHADNHNVIFHPSNPTTVFVVNDGGVFKSSDDGFTWSWEVRNYVTTQFYKVAEGDGRVMGGTQDNGTLLMDPSSSQPKYAVRTPGIDVDGVLRDGDGGYAEISKLNPSVMFKAMQYGVLGRSVDGGENFSLVFPKSVGTVAGVGDGGFASFVTPFALWEKFRDPLSTDSIEFAADSVFLSIGFGNGSTTYSGKIDRPQPSAQLIPEGLVIRVGLLEVTSDANGDLSGDGTGTYNATTGNFTVTFNQPVSLEIQARAAVRYDAGAPVTVASAINNLPIDYTLTTNLEPNESVMIQDPVQAMYVMGITPYFISGRNSTGGIWLSRDVLNNSSLVRTPEFYHIASLSPGDVPYSIGMSGDGNTVWVGTYSFAGGGVGKLYKISNLQNARDSASMSIDDLYVDGNLADSSTSVVTDTVVQVFNQVITDIAVHPNDPDRVVVTTGNYGASQYVYYSNNGTDPKPTFTNAQGDLPEMPVYTAIFNYKSDNMDQVVIGTEEGVFVTDDVSSSNPNWVPADEGMANVPVFDLIQQKTVRTDLVEPTDYEGAIYAGTHGRGIFRSGSASGPVSIRERELDNEDGTTALEMYPNPAANRVSFALDLERDADVVVSVRNINGQLVKTSNFKKVSRDTEELSVDVSRLSPGTYILSVHADRKVTTGKLIVTR